MLEKILKLYVTSMAGDVRSPTPHLVGPPGCGKSTSVEQAAKVLGVGLHTINVSRLSPLEIEGVQMPTSMETDDRRLTMLTATFWTQLQEGDILLLDEFLRGFPEVYNGLLDILTSRKVGAFELPKVFIIAASNSVTAYDMALTDRLMHLPVDDPRHAGGRQSPAYRRIAEDLVKHIGLLPEMAKSSEMYALLDAEVLPMFEMLDQINGKAVIGATTTKGRSVRNLIGQAKLREVQSPNLRELLAMNNIRAMSTGKPQYVVLLDNKSTDKRYAQLASTLKGNGKLTAVQRANLEINLQLIELENDSKEKGETDDDDIFV